MESHTRGLWIFVAVVAVAMVLCAAALVAIGLGVITLPKTQEGLGTLGGDRITRSFDVGETPTLEIDNFAGGVTVRAGEGTTIQVVATKKALSSSTRDKIEVQMTEQAGGLRIKTQRPSGLSMGSVDLDITTPAGTRLTLHTGSGGVEVEGLTGTASVDTGSGGIELRDVRSVTDASTGSGGITIEGAEGPVRLETGSGGIDYEGTPQGECWFQTGSGGIDLTLPEDLNAKVDLSTGSGSIRVDFNVAGDVGRRQVQGTIGTGDQATIHAQTGSGSIELKRQ